MDATQFDSLHCELTDWKIGPFHPSLPGPMKLRLKLDGEIMVSAEVETGFIHRGLEKILEGRTWQSSIAYADRLDPEAAIFAEFGLCLAVEEIADIFVPPRAQRIRVILSELSRFSSHLGYMVRFARSLGSETMLHYLLRDRERILDLFELLTGARFSMNFLRFGGVNADITDGFVERVLEFCDLIQIRMKEYNDLLTYNLALLKRTKGYGRITVPQIHQFGITGPNARASGVLIDVRKFRPYSGYEAFDFDLPRMGEGSGDPHDRLLVRLREIGQGIDILKQAADRIPDGDYLIQRIDPDFRVPQGEAYAVVESSRGLLGCHVVSDGKSPRPARIQFRVPSLASLAIIPEIIRGIHVEDLSILLASLDLSIAEADR